MIEPSFLFVTKKQLRQRMILLIAISIFLAFLVVSAAWKILKWLWFHPKKKEKHLREMGFNGNPYRFLIGDSKEMGDMATQASISPIHLSDDIVPRIAPFIHRTVTKYGDNSFIWIGTLPCVLISDPETVKEILSKNYTFHKMSTPLDSLLAKGLATYEGEKWEKHRKLITPAFHAEKLRGMLPSFYSSCLDMMRRWEEAVPCEGSAELDVWPHLQTLTGDAISRTAFGSSYEEGRRIFELQKEQFGLVLNAVQKLVIPGWRFLPTRTNRRMREIKKEIESCIMGIIEKRLKAIEAGESSGGDLLGVLLESNHKEIQANGENSGISLKDVIEECKLFYIAGQETTSSLLVWTIVLLGQHPDWQERARDEVLRVVGKSDQPDSQQLNHLKTVNMILFEVLRLYPPAIMLGRTAKEETRVKDVTLPAGIQLFLPAILMQQERRVWGDDAKEFKPERFSGGIFKATKGQLTYFPFGNGPRTCIGQNFAMLEAKMALAMILQRFSFEVSPAYAHAPEVVMILQPQMGAQLILRRIQA